MQTVSGDSYVNELKKYEEGPRFLPSWTVTKGEEIVKVSSDGTVDALSPGDATEIFDGETLLYIIASRYEYKNDIAKLLIEHGVDINAQNINGFTALHKAILRYNIDLVRILLENGADPYIINSANENSLEYAEDLKRLDQNQGLNYDDIDVIIAIIKTYMSAINIQKTFRGKQTRNKLKTELAEKQLVQAKLPFGFQESELIAEQLKSLYPSKIRP